MNTHRRYARALATGAFCLAFAAVAVAVWSAVTFGVDDGGYIVPVVCFVFGSVVLSSASKRERAAGRRAALEQFGRDAVEGFRRGLTSAQARRTDTNGDS
ncbi:hypothetical protein [Streptomyces prunicolor]|uniref:hypothetical protein n=1 Tax=Streptomyces prunicolor TaxID=67348 RepID=UPI00037664C1|nr:hypothetical protein [Streptomyces prunicolor]